MDPNRIGAIAETAIAADATRLGFGVLYPLVDGGRYDLVFDVGTRLVRVQCKSARRQGDIVLVNARTSRRAPEGFRRTVYTPDEVDVIAAYCPELNRCFAISTSDFPASGGMHLRLSPTRNGQR